MTVDKNWAPPTGSPQQVQVISTSPPPMYQPPAPTPVTWQGYQYPTYPMQIRCARCGSDRLLIQQVDKGGSALGAFLTVILLLIPIIGWIALFFILVSKRETISRATCQNCGASWNTPRNQKFPKPPKKPKRSKP